MDNINIDITNIIDNVQIEINEIIDNVIINVDPIGIQGEKGDKGDGGNSISRIAGENIGGQRVVVTGNDGLLYYANNSNISHSIKVLGITNQAASIGENCNVLLSGELIESSWNWDTTKLVYLADNGLMTQIYNPLAFNQVIGFPTSSTSLNIKIYEPIII